MSTAMTLFVDTKYIHQISFRLRNFKHKSQTLWNFSCPICGDSQKNKTKARGNIYEVKNHLNFKCHNCSISSSFANFLKNVDISLHKEYVAEKFFNGNGKTIEKPKEEIPVGKKPPRIIAGFGGTHMEVLESKVNLPSILKLPANNECRKYVVERKIPVKKHNDLYYAENFVEWTKSIMPGLIDNLPEHGRLVNPFRNKEGKIFAYQGRALNKRIQPKYYTIKLDKDLPLMYGLNTCNFKEDYYVVEGPIDAMFLNNAVALGGLKLPVLLNGLDKSNAIIVFDNEPRNIHLIKKIEKAIDSHFKICLLPNTFKKLKDINDYIKSGMTAEEMEEFLSKNVTRDLQAKLLLSQWRKYK